MPKNKVNFCNGGKLSISKEGKYSFSQPKKGSLGFTDIYMVIGRRGCLFWTLALAILSLNGGLEKMHFHENLHVIFDL